MNRVLSLQAIEEVSIKSKKGKKKKGASGISVLGCGASSMGSIAMC